MTALIVFVILAYIVSKMDIADDIRSTWFEANNGDCLWFGAAVPASYKQPGYLLLKVSFTSRFLGMATVGYMAAPEAFMGAKPKTQDAVVKATAAKGRISVHEIRNYTLVEGERDESGH